MEEAEAAKKAKAEKVVQRSAEERAERARLLGEYGYDTDPVDEEGNPLPQEDGEGGGTGVRKRKGWRREQCGRGRARSPSACMHALHGENVMSLSNSVTVIPSIA